MLSWLENLGTAVLARKGTIALTVLVVGALDALVLAGLVDSGQLLRWCEWSLRTPSPTPDPLFSILEQSR